MTKYTVECNASGATLTIDTDTYIGDLPDVYGYQPDDPEVTWVNYDYAKIDPNWGVEGVPEGQPVWEVNPR